MRGIKPVWVADRFDQSERKGIPATSSPSRSSSLASDGDQILVAEQDFHAKGWAPKGPVFDRRGEQLTINERGGGEMAKRSKVFGEGGARREENESL